MSRQKRFKKPISTRLSYRKRHQKLKLLCQKPPPKPEKETRADAQNSARQQQHITESKKRRVTDRAPRPQLDHSLLKRTDKINDRKKTRQQRE